MNLVRKIGLEESKQLELAILLDVADCCERNNLRYYLAYGTLLGAVRHHGFIPWDDDIDIEMPRADYNRLIEIYNTQRGRDYYELVPPMADKSRHSIVKVVDNRTVKIEKNVDYSHGTLGVDIDIFPLDGAPSDEKTFLGWYEKLMRLYFLHTLNILDPKVKLKRRVIYLVRFLTGGRKTILKRAAHLHDMYPFENSDHVACVDCAYDSPNTWAPKFWYETIIRLDFEGHQFCAPSEYDSILTKEYGDYMTPPEVKESHHCNVSYWKEDFTAI